MGDDGAPGPNGMRHFEQSLQAVAGLGLDREQTFEVIGQVDDYVFGYSLREVQERAEQEHGWSPEVVDFFRRELATGDYPLISEFFGDDFEATFEEAMEFMSDNARFAPRPHPPPRRHRSRVRPQIAPARDETGGDSTPRSTLVRMGEQPRTGAVDLIGDTVRGRPNRQGRPDDRAMRR